MGDVTSLKLPVAEVVAEHWLETERGLPTVDALTDLARPHADAFTCGPAPFMAAVTDALKALDFPRSRRHVERFASLAVNPFDR